MTRCLWAFLLLLSLTPAVAGAAQDQGGAVMDGSGLAVAIFAGGCFWCTEADFEKVPGVVDVVSGYCGGKEANPTYEQVSAGATGHLESVQVTYDPQKVGYSFLLDWFWRHIDPTDDGGQFVDRGRQYRSAIFFMDEEQHRLAEESKQRLMASGKFLKPIVTDIRPCEAFYKAEDYHQNYHLTHSIKYKYYRYHSGRDQFLEKTWGTEVNRLTPVIDAAYVKPNKAILKKTLTPIQYEVTQEQGTEPPFKNEYWDNKKAGIYVDILSGEPLFSSTDKYDSGTGWPSFTRPLEPANIVEREDRSLFMVRVEIRSKLGDNHIGHVFNDGPPPTGLRYCMNSAALRFIPREELEKDGYGKYLKLFEN